MLKHLYGAIINGELQTSDAQLEGYKPLVYAEIPEFDQATQYVVQNDPQDLGASIYLGVEVLTLPAEDNSENPGGMV